jgi:hypothetical protein
MEVHVHVRFAASCYCKCFAIQSAVLAVLSCATVNAMAEQRYRAQKDYRGVLPPEVQAKFDHAKSLERGRRGRQLSNMLAPNLAAALEAYEAAMAAMDASASREGDVARVLEGYAARAAAVREQLATAEAKVLQTATFDESRRSFQVFPFDLDQHDIVGTTAQVLRLGRAASADLSKLHDSLSPDSLHGPPPICPALLCALARERKLPRDWRFLAGHAPFPSP